MGGGILLPERRQRMTVTVRVIALNIDNVIVDGSHRYPVPHGTFEEAEPGQALARLVEKVAARFDEAGGVLLLDGPAAHSLGFPAKLPEKLTARKRAELAALFAPAELSGWKVGEPGPWFTFWTPADDPRRTVHVGIMPWIDPGRTGGMHADDQATFAGNLATYHTIIGVPFHHTPGVAGGDCLRSLGPKDPPTWRAHNTEKLPEGCHRAEYDIVDWAGGHDPRRGGFLHTYDANAMYLNAMLSAEVAVRELTNTGRIDFDPALSGYWQIPRPHWNDPNMPDPLGYRPAHDKPGQLLWVTTPTMALLRDMDAEGIIQEPPVLNSWTGRAPLVWRRGQRVPGRSTTRVGRRFAERLRDALVDAPEGKGFRVDHAIKATYSEAVGMCGREGGRVYRIDWRHTWIAKARALLWWRLWNIGMTEARWPVAVNVDAATYASQEADPIAGCPRGLTIGRGLGQFKVKGTERKAIAS